MRGSTDPDKFPEYGDYNIQFAISPIAKLDYKLIDKLERDYMTPVIFSSITGRGKGDKPLTDSFLSLDAENCSISDILTEDGSVTVRVRSYSDKPEKARISYKNGIKHAEETTIDGVKIRDLKTTKNGVEATVKPYEILSLRIK